MTQADQIDATLDPARLDPMGSGLPVEADIMLKQAPPPPFDWIREGTSCWMFDEDGKCGFPRVGVEAEPHTWDNRLYQSNVVFLDS
jgi:hypothetical protein